MLCYLLSDDLIFTSRVVGTARAAGLDVKAARSQEQLRNLLAKAEARCVLVDLHNPGLAIVELMKSLPSPRPYVVGYGSHVDTQTLSAARAAGCDLVLPRSKFVEDLATSLPAWFGKADGH